MTVEEVAALITELKDERDQLAEEVKKLRDDISRQTRPERNQNTASRAAASVLFEMAKVVMRFPSEQRFTTREVADFLLVHAGTVLRIGKEEGL